MAEHGEEAKAEQSLMDNISEKIHHDSSSSSSDSDTEKEKKAAPADETAKEKVFRLFGRERSVHHVFGGGKPADVFLWRKPKISARILVGETVVYVLFELVEYHLLTLLCHLMIVGLVLMFLWSNVHTLIYKTAPNIPVVSLPEKPFLQLASEVRHHVNWAFELLHNFASGKDLKKLLIVIAGLWVLSVVGSWCNFLTLFYISFVLLHTLPVLYEKYEHKVDPLVEMATIKLKMQYGVFDAKEETKITFHEISGYAAANSSAPNCSQICVVHLLRPKIKSHLKVVGILLPHHFSLLDSSVIG